MRYVSYMVARGSEGRRLVQRYIRSEVASSIPQTPALFNVSATRRSLLMAPSNPLPLSKETCEEMIRLLPACVCACVCVGTVQDLSGRSLTPVVTVTPGSQTRTCCQATASHRKLADIDLKPRRGRRGAGGGLRDLPDFDEN